VDHIHGSENRFLICSCPVLYVEKGDILVLLAGTAIVIIIAVLANHSDFSGLPYSIGTVGQSEGIETKSPVSGTAAPHGITPNAVETTGIEKSNPAPYRIFYTDKPFTYPVYRMPDDMETFGASEIPGSDRDWVPFAFIEDTRGGLTEVFSVPYPLWVINTTVIAEHHPQYGNLRFALCYADTGGIIEGEEILNRGTSYRVIQVSNKAMYIIIAAGSIDHFRIVLETPRVYYDAYRQRQ
jgi:hypothetical protein